MSMGYRGKTTNLGRENTAVQAAAEQESKLGEIPGEIVSFDPGTQTATIKPLYKPKVNGEPIDMPELLEVPVRFTRAGNGGITFPIQTGDKVSLRPQMRSSENYHTGGDYEASDARYASLSDMEAYLDGGEPVTDPIPGFDSSNTHVRFSPDGSYGMRGSKDGQIAIEGSQGNIYDLLVQVVELLAADQLSIKYGSSAGSGHELQNKAQYEAIAAKLRAMAL